MANKIKYGLTNVYYALCTIDNTTGAASYQSPVRIPGAVALSMQASGDSTSFHADNVIYWVGQSNNGYEGELEIARIPASFETDVLGAGSDSAGVTYESADATTQTFALLFQFEGDEHPTRHVLYNCTCSRPEISGSTKEETIEPQTETLNLTAASIYVAALEKNIVKSKVEYEGSAYSTWFSSVVQPSASEAPATPANQDTTSNP